MPENRKDLVDEQKRRARRRLVGAAVLALAAAVIVPLFLESEPKPLGQDVQILIPAVEGSKFVNQLSANTDSATKSAGGEPAGANPVPKPESKPEAAPGKPSETLPSAGRAEGKAAAAVSEATQETRAEAVKPPAPGVQAAPKAADSPAAAAPPSAAATSKPAAAKNGSKPAAAGATVSGKSADSGFVVQLGAYTDAMVAQELQARLKAAGFAAYVERIETSKEKLHRVRVGPYPSRDAADGVRAQLKAKGHSGIVAPLS